MQAERWREEEEIRDEGEKKRSRFCMGGGRGIYRSKRSLPAFLTQNAGKFFILYFLEAYQRL